jgi:hypothetical protein
MNKARIAAVLLVRLMVSLILIYLLDTYYYPGSALNWFYALMIGTGVMLLDPRGVTVTVHIKPIDGSGRGRMIGFINRQNSGNGRWKGTVLPDDTGQVKTYLVGLCAETFSLFGKVLAWEIRDNINNPDRTQFSVSVETGALNL